MTRFPIHNDYGRRPKHLPQSVPWELVAPCERRARSNHDQSLQRLAERGGLCPVELWCVVHDKSWRDRCDEATAELWLLTVVA